MSVQPCCGTTSGVCLVGSWPVLAAIGEFARIAEQFPTNSPHSA